MKMFEVGGCCRDEILGVRSNDIDFSVVLDEHESKMMNDGFTVNGYTPFEVMTLSLRRMGFKIFVETPEHLTVRAQFPKGGSIYGNTGPMLGEGYRAGLTADFVLARKESGYTDGRRPDFVEPGTLLDDLARRDFTMNAIAKDADGSLIDPFNGVQDIHDRVIRAVGKAQDRLDEDALRAVRALRFSVTLGFRIDHELAFAMQTRSVLDAIVNNISDDRINTELGKMFKFDTVKSLRALDNYRPLTDALFSGRVRLTSTMKEK